MTLNQNSAYGQAQIGGMPFTTGRVFVVSESGDEARDNMSQLFPTDSEGIVRLHATITGALSACTAGNGDVIVLTAGSTTAPTAVELESAATKGVSIQPMVAARADGKYVTQTNVATLPQSADGALFTITGKVIIHQIVGEVTTVIQTQTNNTLLKINPTVGADVDLCSVLSITAKAVGSLFTITGTFANAMINTVSGAVPTQASPVLLTAGSLELECAASNTGAVKWTCVWEPVDPGSQVIAA